MKRLLTLLVIPAVSLFMASSGLAQSFPVVSGTMEFQFGLTGMALPENSGGGSLSAQPELRVGRFVAEGVELQLVGDARVWPLGVTAPSSYGVSANLLWFPNLGPTSRNLYLLVGGGGALVDPPSAAVGSSFDPLGRVGVGVKVPLSELSVSWTKSLFFTVEFREEYVAADESDYLSGISFSVSQFR
ncbi:MAG: hypothetical protein DHS20C21_07270 [Gemmatimonadota bacterium]|nr:MAG: hypothetical protein DHS20C21_07270 [Gemmatimonadota bacterium]